MAPPVPTATAKPAEPPPAAPPPAEKPAEPAPPPPAAPAPKPAPAKAKAEVKADVKADAKPPVDTVVAADDWMRFILTGRFGAARLGGPAGNIFGHDFSAANEGWDHTQKGIGVGLDFKLWDPTPYFQLWAGGRLNYRNISGNSDAPGELHGVEVGPSLCLASAGLYTGKKGSVIQGPELCSQFSYLYMAGKSTAGNNFSVDDTSGHGYSWLNTFSPIAFTVGSTKIQPNFFIDTANIPNARGDSNAPTLAMGGMLNAVWTFDKPKEVIRTETEKVCTGVDNADNVRTLKEDVKTLRDAVAESHREFIATAEILKKAGYDSKKMRDAIRAGFVEEKKAKLIAQLEAEKKTADEIKEAVKAKEPEYKALAETIYGETYDYFSITMPTAEIALDETFVMPDDKDCDALSALYTQLNNERIALEKVSTKIDERKLQLLIALGNPPSVVTKVVRHLGGLAFAQFPPVNFKGGRPDYNKVDGPDMKKIEEFYAANKGRAPLNYNDAGLKKAFAGVFAGDELANIYRFSEYLNGTKAMPGVKLKGLSEDDVKALIKTVPIVIVGHTSVTDGSREGNIILSNNRARAVLIALALFGVDEKRLRSEGRGPDEPVVPEVDDRGKKVKNLSWAMEKNRRIDVVVDMEKMETPGGAATGDKAPPPAAPPPAAPPPPKAPPAKGEVK